MGGLFSLFCSLPSHQQDDVLRPPEGAADAGFDPSEVPAPSECVAVSGLWLLVNGSDHVHLSDATTHRGARAHSRLPAQ